ncbi:hypothetical protein [Streptomyces sp. NPDC001404]|uniref:hypothetical protein n=1 Tax=Streptomyces sp. NPDC001404 TaxID=3364571 RepID=UPI0036BFFCF8
MSLTPTGKAVADVAERTVLTYVEAFLGLLLAANATDLVDLSVLQSAAVAAIPAALTVLKGAIGTQLGSAGTASWLPTTSDPATRH